MKTVTDNRHDWLECLIKEHGSITALNIALDRVKTDATLSQIRSKSAHSRTGAPRAMGEKIARDIELKLGLPRGTLDGPAPIGASKQTGSAGTVSRQASEKITPYQVVRWPFASITPDEWSRIPLAARQMLELQIKSLVPTAKNNNIENLEETQQKTGPSYENLGVLGMLQEQ